MRYQKTLAFLAIASLVSFAPLAAQQKKEPEARQPAIRTNPGTTTSTTADQRTNWKNADHQLATCVAIDNQEEIALARFAEKKLQNKEAQEFAQMMIDDHSQFVKKLEQFAPEATQEGFLEEGRSTRQTAATDSPDAKRQAKAQPRATQPNQAGQRNQAGQVQTRTAAKPNLDQAGGLPIDYLQLHKELAQQCLNDTQDMLSEKKESEFDECFIGLQIAKHAAMKSKLEVLQRHASSELRDLLAEGQKTTASHLEHAQKIMKQLAENSSDRRSDSK
jgi:predicted outer membrane protein